MTVQITIIGLGQIGASAGLALAEHKNLLHRVGHDKDPGVAKQAKKMDAVDDIKSNLPAAVREAKIVLLSLPVHEIRATLETIAKDLPSGAVVMDTAPVKEAVSKWAQEILPEGAIRFAWSRRSIRSTCIAMNWGSKRQRRTFSRTA